MRLIKKHSGARRRALRRVLRSIVPVVRGAWGLDYLCFRYWPQAADLADMSIDIDVK